MTDESKKDTRHLSDTDRKRAKALAALGDPIPAGYRCTDCRCTQHHAPSCKPPRHFVPITDFDPKTRRVQVIPNPDERNARPK